MINIYGEFRIAVDKVAFENTDNLREPYGFIRKNDIDLSIFDKSGGGPCLRICGDNDWGYLLADALQPLLDYALYVYECINEKMKEYKGIPEVIGLGKNEFRAVDIIHRLRGFGEPIKIHKGIPVVQLQENNKIELLGQKVDSDLPFK